MDNNELKKPLLPLGKALLALPALMIAAALFLILRPNAMGRGWTVMVCMVGTDNQKNWADPDLDEMRRALRDDTALFVLTGGPQGSEFFSADACRLYRVDRKNTTLLQSFSGSVSDPGMLEHLLTAGLEKPADRTMLILWDHGTGAMGGYGTDGNAVSVPLHLSDLARAMRACGVDKTPLTLIGFDACLMADCETALTLAPFAEYLVASQETEPAQGWDYSFMSALQPGADGAVIGEAAVRAFTAYYQDHYARFPQLRQPYTLSCVRLHQTSALADTVDALLGRLGDRLDADGFAEVSRIRESATEMGHYITSTDYDLVDLQSLAQSCPADWPEAEALRQALTACVVCRDGSVSSLGGLSLYFPQRAKAANRAAWQQRAQDMPLRAAWQGFIARYTEELLADRGLPMPLSAVKGYSVTLNEEQKESFIRGKFFVLCGNDEEGYWNVYSSPECTLEGNALIAHYDGKALMVRTEKKGDQVLYITYNLEDERAAYYTSTVILVPDPFGETPLPRTANLRLEKNKATGQWTLLSAMEVPDGLMTGRQELPVEEISLKQQMEVWALHPIFMPRSERERDTMPYYQWEYVPSLEGGTLLLDQVTALEDMPLPRGQGQQYWLQIVVHDDQNREYAAPLFPI